MLLLLASMTSIFFAGYFSNDRILESVATYVAKIVNENTENKKYCGLTVQSTDDSGDIADSYNEFHNLYGLFRQTKVTFGSAMNLFNNEKKDKDHDIRMTLDSQNISNNLSLFYLGAVGSDAYKGHYKHYVYPFETMFKDDKTKYNIVPKKYVAYISQTHADRLLERYGEERDSAGNFNEKQYKTLLDDANRNTVDISIDSSGEIYQFAILNIYFQSNYYYEGMSEILDDFIAVSYYVPENLRNEQKNIYFLSEYPYQNEYFMNYVNELYSNGKYKIEINHNNIRGEIDDNFATSFYYESLNNPHNWAVILIFILGSCLIILSVFVSFKKKYYRSKLFIFYILLVCALPYFIFKAIYTITYSADFFTFLSCKAYFVALSSVLLALVLFNKVDKFLKQRKRVLGVLYNEIDI